MKWAKLSIVLATLSAAVAIAPQAVFARDHHDVARHFERVNSFARHAYWHNVAAANRVAAANAAAAAAYVPPPVVCNTAVVPNYVPAGYATPYYGSPMYTTVNPGYSMGMGCY